MRVHIVCQNWREERIIPRMARALAERLGWSLSDHSAPCDVLYLSAYFEAQRVSPPAGARLAAYFTHREEEPPGNAKAALYDEIARRVDLRVATCRLYAEPLRRYGPTLQAAPPLERERFTIALADSGEDRGRPVVGFSGYTYANGRKGEELARRLVESPVGAQIEWRASGRGWPVPTRAYAWEEMPSFYQGLDVLVCTSRVEGVPMPVLEALACGKRVVIPGNVGILDELPDIAGIERYGRDDPEGLIAAVERAAFPDEAPDPEALRAATERYSVEAWCEEHARAFGEMFGDPSPLPLSPSTGRGSEMPLTPSLGPSTGRGGRGIYCVAFGEQARGCARRMMESAKRHMPDIPIALCAAEAIGPEDVLIVQPDRDIGGRRAKLAAYELAPAEWKAVLYLDADTEVVAPIYPFFEWVEDGWDLVITKDPHLMDTMRSYARRNNASDMAALKEAIHTHNALQLNGGVWAFGRNERVAAFFQRWQSEYERHLQRDQGALIRALYADPLKVWILGNEWNTFPKYEEGITTAGLMHYPGEARRWKGLIPGRIDSEAAWEAVRRFEASRRGEGGTDG